LTTKDITDTQIALQLFPGYSDADTAIFEEFVNPDAKPESGFVVDFLGSRIRATSVWKEARTLEGQLLGIPVPADFHAEAIEWIGLLKAVRSATDQYVAMELGAGFGPWIIAGGLAAKLRGIQNIRLCAVEGDPQHFQFLHQHFLDNGFEPSEHTLLQAGVGVNAGVAEWPILEGVSASESWGCRPLHSGGDYLGRQFQNTTRIDIVPMRDLVVREPSWDLIHIDVQGEEVEICRSCIDELNARVRWIIAGTHSRKLDGDFLELMCRAGWFLEHEKPSKFAFVPNPTTLEAMITLDGTQVWRNLRFMRAGDSLTSFSQEITSSVHEFRVEARGTFVLDVNAKNTGTESWFGGTQTAPINASYRWLDSKGNVLPIEGNRSPLHRAEVRPGEDCPLRLQVAAPTHSGSYALLISMVQEGVAWFHDRGARPLVLQVTVD
jgi:FkbM family methyltransferase